MGREVSRDELFKGNYTLGEFVRIPIENSFYISCFLFFFSILRVELLRVIILGKFSPRLNCLIRGYIPGEGICPWR